MCEKFSDLRSEIEFKRRAIYTQQLNMSVGELINLYENEEIELEPAFQRLFRWNDFQETNFIESILLGYPIPAIFVLQRRDGVWDLIDGVQRLSTIYHFVGILKDKDGNKISPLTLTSAKILKNLKDKRFMSDDKDHEFDTSSRIDFKRASLPVIILKHGSEQESKYELFRRLNTGGSHLSNQEIRNALILMYNEDTFNSMSDYVEKTSFKDMINLSENKLELRMDMDILTRFLVMRKISDEELQQTSSDIDINEFLDEKVKNIITDEDFDITSELAIFDELINFLSEQISDDYGFKLYDRSADRFKGAFNWFIFETLIWGCCVLKDVNDLRKNPEYYLEKIKSLESIGSYLAQSGKSNVKVIQRFKMAKLKAHEVFCSE